MRTQRQRNLGVDPTFGGQVDASTPQAARGARHTEVTQRDPVLEDVGRRLNGYTSRHQRRQVRRQQT
ncbi:MAG: hypothetical protein ACM30D_00095, partial [Hyphomicrobiales bacterium]